MHPKKCKEKKMSRCFHTSQPSPSQPPGRDEIHTHIQHNKKRFAIQTAVPLVRANCIKPNLKNHDTWQNYTAWRARCQGQCTQAPCSCKHIQHTNKNIQNPVLKPCSSSILQPKPKTFWDVGRPYNKPVPNINKRSSNQFQDVPESRAKWGGKLVIQNKVPIINSCVFLNGRNVSPSKQTYQLPIPRRSKTKKNVPPSILLTPRCYETDKRSNHLLQDVTRLKKKKTFLHLNYLFQDVTRLRHIPITYFKMFQDWGQKKTFRPPSKNVPRREGETRGPHWLMMPWRDVRRTPP